jgi:hypothetical protein
MRKTRVLLFLFVLLGSGLFAQSENNTTTPAGHEPLLQQIAVLKAQAVKTNDAYVNVLAAATGSRASGAAAVTALNDACNVYLAELKTQAAATTDAATQAALAREIALVKKLQADHCPAGK